MLSMHNPDSSCDSSYDYQMCGPLSGRFSIAAQLNWLMLQMQAAYCDRSIRQLPRLLPPLLLLLVRRLLLSRLPWEGWCGRAA